MLYDLTEYIVSAEEVSKLTEKIATYPNVAIRRQLDAIELWMQTNLTVKTDFMRGIVKERLLDVLSASAMDEASKEGLLKKVEANGKTVLVGKFEDGSAEVLFIDGIQEMV